MRWFLLPSEAQQVLLGVTTPKATPPFQPRQYPGLKTQNILHSDALSTETTLLWKSKSQERSNGVAELCDSNEEELKEFERKKKDEVVNFHCPPKNIYKPTTEVCTLLILTLK